MKFATSGGALMHPKNQRDGLVLVLCVVVWYGVRTFKENGDFHTDVYIPYARSLHGNSRSGSPIATRNLQLVFEIFRQKEVSLSSLGTGSFTVSQAVPKVVGFFVTFTSIMRFFFSSQGAQKRRPGASSVSSNWFLFRPPRLALSLNMGSLLCKPVTLAQLHEALNPIKADIKEQFDLIKAVLLVPDGDAEAKQATVAIKLGNENNNEPSVWGHGVVVRAPDHSSNGDLKFYLLSAAHVLIFVANAMSDNASNHLLLSWPQTNDAPSFVERQRGALVLHKDYISRGSHDYGFMELKSLSEESCPFVGMKPLYLRSPTVGHCVVAHGMVYLRGEVTGGGTPPRFSVLAHSIPGSSGAPIFSNDRYLVGVVHGSSKHKGHSNGNNEDDATVVYADTLQVTEGLYRISEGHWRWLRMAEEVPPEVASETEGLSRIETQRDENGVDVEVEVETEFTQELWDLWDLLGMDRNPMSAVTLDRIMDVLKENVVLDENQTGWIDSEFKLVYVPNSTLP